ncbi:TPA: hypothetical protein ACKP5U_003289 [Pseudomonas aeruginosa]|uniref:hypothetical protein n=1 Tax=Pseudomonas aeruginosa TaxID=287 RepID=UPI00155AAB19|nr:hypothetical protein [Pseudomonas aeruginosa]HEJ2170549.1 hypothetical protein [Pseudomonas aeruginosa]HEK1445036.1 hypothetical protein [Pseudomonas aeruginosa]
MGDFNIRIPKGCSCDGVEIGDYTNTVELPTPPHMLRIGRIGCLEFRETICVDKCIANAVQALWDLGIVTTGCCCGHNQADGYIGVWDREAIQPTVLPTR